MAPLKKVESAPQMVENNGVPWLIVVFGCIAMMSVLIVDVDGMPILPRSASTEPTTTNWQDKEQKKVENRASQFPGGNSTGTDGEEGRTEPIVWAVVGGVLGALVVVGGLAAVVVVVVKRRRSGRRSANRIKSAKVDDQKSSSRKSTGSMRAVTDEMDRAENLCKVCQHAVHPLTGRNIPLAPPGFTTMPVFNLDDPTITETRF